MKKCPFCAEEIQDEAIVCRFCRRDLPQVQEAQPVNIPAVKFTEEEKEARKRKGQGTCFILAACFILFSCLCFFLVPLLMPDSQNETEQSLTNDTKVEVSNTEVAFTQAPTLEPPTPTREIDVLENEYVQLILKEIEENNQTEIEIDPSLIRIADNPIGDGDFVYVDETNFFGVERYFIWIIIDEEIVNRNGATENISPSFPYATEIEDEVWAKTRLDKFQAGDVINYLFNNGALEPVVLEPVVIEPTAEYEILERIPEETRKEIYYAVVDAEDKVNCLFGMDTDESKALKLN